MEDFVRSMTYPFLACLVLAGIHVYLGIHVISRKVIFVDLALAQIAALGTVHGVLLGYQLDEDPWAIKGFSLLFAVIGAAVFSFTRMRRERVPQEAVIGIAYAVALAATILASAHLPHGAEEVREILAGSILWVTGNTVLVTAILYAAVGAVLAASHRKLLRISVDPEAAAAEGIRIRLWDFLFYVLFGVVVTSSVAIAGILLVFSFLIIPAAVAVLFAQRVGTRLLIGWGVGTVVSFAGVAISYDQDLPSGPTIVVAFGVFLVLAASVRFIAGAPHRGAALGRVATGFAAIALVVFGTWLFRKPREEGPIAMLASPNKNERAIAVRTMEGSPDFRDALLDRLPDLLADSAPEIRVMALEIAGRRREESALPAVHRLLSDPDDHVREACVRSIRNTASRASIEAIYRAVPGEEDEYLRIEMAHALLELGDLRGAPFLLDLMDEGEASQVRKESHEALVFHVPVELPFRPDVAPGENDQEVEAYRAFLRENRDALRFEPATKKFLR